MYYMYIRTYVNRDNICWVEKLHVSNYFFIRFLCSILLLSNFIPNGVIKNIRPIHILRLLYSLSSTSSYFQVEYAFRVPSFSIIGTTLLKANYRLFYLFISYIKIYILKEQHLRIYINIYYIYLQDRRVAIR